MTRGRALLAALLVTLATPATWPIALGTFLVRGGIVVVLLPIVVLPTTVGIGNTFGPTLQTVAFGSIPIEIIVVTASIGLGGLLWIIAGGWLAAALEAEGARIVASDEDATGPAAGPVAQPTGRVAARILTARLLASLPLGVILALGSVRLVFATYRELTTPIDVATPIAVRVLGSAPEVVIAVIVAWTLAEIVGAVAARRIALTDAPVGAALVHAVAVLLREPLSSLARFWLPWLVLLIILMPFARVADLGSGAVGSVLGDQDDPIGSLVTVVAFVGLWIIGLLLIAVVCAWRAAIWTVVEVAREGTFGGSANRRPGHWRLDRSSATLWPGRPWGRSRRRG